LTQQTAEQKLQDNSADLVAFGRGFLANPDFVSRLKKNVSLNDVDFHTFYAPGEQGYTDYPLYNSK
jgi:N-ethylmaleimide reductase